MNPSRFVPSRRGESLRGPRRPLWNMESLRFSRPSQWQLDETALFRGVVDPLRRLAVLARFGQEDIGHERLRIAVVKREPARLNLHHDLVPRKENMVGRRES